MQQRVEVRYICGYRRCVVLCANLPSRVFTKHCTGGGLRLFSNVPFSSCIQVTRRGDGSSSLAERPDESPRWRHRRHWLVRASPRHGTGVLAGVLVLFLPGDRLP